MQNTLCKIEKKAIYKYFEIFLFIFLLFSSIPAFAERVGALKWEKIKRQEVKVKQNIPQNNSQNTENTAKNIPQNTSTETTNKANQNTKTQAQIKDMETKISQSKSAKANHNFYIGTSINIIHNSYSASEKINLEEKSYINAIINEINSGIADLKEEEIALQEQIKELESEIGNTQSLENEVKKAIELKEKQISDLRAQMVNSSLEIIVSQILPQIQLFEKELANLKQQGTNFEAQVSQLEDSKNTVEQELNMLPLEMQILADKIAEAQIYDSEIKGIKNDASALNLNVSLLAGYIKTFNKLMVGAELGLDLGKIGIGSISNDEISANSNYGISLTSRLGYKVKQDLTLYGGVGLKFQKFNLAYVNKFVDSKTDANIKSLKLLIGGEKQFNEKISIFVELSHSSSLNKARFEATKQDLEFKAIEAKVGVRYFIPTTLFN
jgi:opacity protein-like surface antigen